MSIRGNKELFSEFLVGIFMLAVLALLAYFTIIISGVDLVGGRSRLPVKVHFEDVGGLKERDSVVLRGMVVGSVSGINLAPDGVDVTLMIQRDVAFREGYNISVASGSLLGGNYLLIEEGDGAEIKRSDDLVLRGSTPHNWMRDLGEVVAKLKSAMAGDYLHNIITNLDASVVSIRNVTGRIEAGEGALGKLLSDESSIYEDLAESVASIKSITEKVDEGDNSIGRLLNDGGNVYTNVSVLVEDLRVSAENLREVSGRLEQGEGTLGRLLSDDDTMYRDLEASVASIRKFTTALESGDGLLGKLLSDDTSAIDDLNITAANLREVTDRLANGEGTLGKLSADDKLYEDVHGLIKDVRQTVDNFRDTTPITAFASLLMGGL